MWGLWNKSLKWSTRPSELLGLDDPYVGWCIDEAVYSWGNFVESQMDEAVASAQRGKGKRKKIDENKIRQQKLAQLLDLPMEVRYRSFREAAGKAPTKSKEE